MRNRVLGILVPCFLALGCSDDTVTGTKPESERYEYCLDNTANCVWEMEILVKIKDRPLVVSGANGIVANNRTGETHQFSTDQSGWSDRFRWSSFPEGSTFSLVVNAGGMTGISWQRYELPTMTPNCWAHPEIEEGVICRWTAELVPTVQKGE